MAANEIPCLVAQIDAVASAHVALELAIERVRPLGVPYVAVVHPHPRLRGGTDIFTLSNFGPEFTRRYESDLYFQSPIVREARSRQQPFLWVAEDYMQRPGDRHVMAALADLGIDCGYTLPFHNRFGEMTLVSFATGGGRHGRDTVLAPVLGELTLTAAFLNGAVGRFLRPAPGPLTRRETQCLQLVANGCTTKEVARELQLSERTVKEYLDQVREKLGARTREQAVFIAMVEGMLHG